jgi:hypothetical protein
MNAKRPNCGKLFACDVHAILHGMIFFITCPACDARYRVNVTFVRQIKGD